MSKSCTLCIQSALKSIPKLNILEYLDSLLIMRKSEKPNVLK